MHIFKGVFFKFFDCMARINMSWVEFFISISFLFSYQDSSWWEIVLSDVKYWRCFISFTKLCWVNISLDFMIVLSIMFIVKCTFFEIFFGNVQKRSKLRWSCIQSTWSSWKNCGISIYILANLVFVNNLNCLQKSTIQSSVRSESIQININLPFVYQIDSLVSTRLKQSLIGRQ